MSYPSIFLSLSLSLWVVSISLSLYLSISLSLYHLSIYLQGTIDLSGSKGGNSAGDHKAAGGGAGGGALKISAPTITIGPAGAIHVDGGDGGDGGGPGQSFFSAATPWSTGAGNGAGGVGVAGGGTGGSGAGSSQNGNVGIGPGASAGSPTHSGVPPGAGGAGHAFAGTNGFGQYTGWTPAGGAAYGDAQLTGGLQGGSGAGGGGNDGDNEEGAGGGGSGGTVYLVAATLHIEGALTAIGGLGGRDDYHYNGGANRECCNNGGPGSVGRVRLDYTSANLSGTVTPAAGYISMGETLSIEGNPAYPSQTRGQYTRAVGLEYGGAAVYKRNGWSLYKRSDGKWYLDFNEVDDTWSGTVNYALLASDTPFTATWNVDMVVVP